MSDAQYRRFGDKAPRSSQVVWVKTVRSKNARLATCSVNDFKPEWWWLGFGGFTICKPDDLWAPIAPAPPLPKGA